MARKKNKQAAKMPLDIRSKMYIVMAVCSLMLLVSVVISFLLVGGLDRMGTEAGSDSADSESLVTESGYDKDQNTIDETKYTSTILEKSDDAGQTYVDETLFLGDSNTARMYRMFDYCSYDNAIGSVGMSARSLADFACVQMKGSSGYVTMAKAVAMMQPKRVILTFGTNDLSPSYSADSFVKAYQEGIQTIVDAYPSVDIIVNSIPPLGQVHSNQNLTQSQVDEYNKALVEMCQKQGWKFLNSAEVLKDSSTGYAKSGYVEASDGIHLTKAAMDDLFEYVRTHSYITEDDRPTLTSIPEHTGDKDVSTQTASSVVTSSSSAPASSSSQATPTPEPASSSQAPSSSQTYTYWEEVIAPTCTEKGYTVHHCNEDSSRDYIDSEVAALGHDGQSQADGSIVCSRCGTVLQAAPPASSSEVTSSSSDSSETTSSDSSTASSGTSSSDSSASSDSSESSGSSSSSSDGLSQDGSSGDGTSAG